MLNGKKIGDRKYKVHLDGYDLGPALKGEGEWPRKEFIYWTDDGSVAAIRYGDWKITFLEQKALGLGLAGAFRYLRAPVTNLRMDPFERAEAGKRDGLPALVHGSHVYDRPGGAYVGQWLQSFKEFPPRQKPGSFNLDRVMEAVLLSIFVDSTTRRRQTDEGGIDQRFESGSASS